MPEEFEMTIPITASDEQVAEAVKNLARDGKLARENAVTRIRLKAALALCEKLSALLEAAGGSHAG